MKLQDLLAAAKQGIRDREPDAPIQAGGPGSGRRPGYASQNTNADKASAKAWNATALAKANPTEKNHTDAANAHGIAEHYHSMASQLGNETDRIRHEASAANHQEMTKMHINELST